MTVFHDLINTMWTILNIEFNTGIGTFSLFDVICAGGLLSIIGMFIGNIIFFAKLNTCNCETLVCVSFYGF